MSCQTCFLKPNQLLPAVRVTIANVPFFPWCQSLLCCAHTFSNSHHPSSGNSITVHVLLPLWLFYHKCNSISIASHSHRIVLYSYSISLGVSILHDYYLTSCLAIIHISKESLIISRKGSLISMQTHSITKVGVKYYGICHQ